MRMNRRLQLAACLAVASWIAVPAPAQESYPNKPIRIVVGYAAGGGNDIIVRVVAPKMSEGLGQPVIIENRPGAQGIIGCEIVARDAADGYTLLMGPSGPMTMNPALYSKLSYDPLRDFAPISVIGSFPLILVVSSALPIHSVKDLIAWAKANPDKSNYGASATPFQLAAELLNQRTGTKFAHIPYKSSGESVNAVMSGQVTMTIMDPPPAIGPLKSGKARGLAVTGATRHANWPELPTLAEAGIPDVEIRLFTGFLAPAGTPAAIVNRLQQEVARVVKLPEIRDRLDIMAIDPSANTPEEFRRIIAADIIRWTAVAKAANIKAD